MQLKLGNNKIDNFFDLLGTKEDSLTYAVGYCLSRNKFLFTSLMYEINIEKYDLENIIIHLQRHDSKNYSETDIEIYDNQNIHIIVEAKKGWNFPSKNQLEKYSSRFEQNGSDLQNILIVLNENNESYVEANFHLENNNYQLQVISWAFIIELSKKSFSIGRHSEKRLIKQLYKYLMKNSTMQNSDSNLVYVVSLGSGFPENWDISWIDIVVKKKKYFHPIGGGRGGWPKEPPNYIAFRYQGRLQSIYHIERYKSIIEPSHYFKEAPTGFKWEKRHYLYDLGPAILPPKLTKNGKRIVRSNRVWAALDLLLTSKTIEEARDLTKERMGDL